jgi:16S rRNA pseudouridine516 synthase
LRLDRYLANSGQGSRKEVKELIRKGMVTVDSLVSRDAGFSINEDGSQQICIGSQTVRLKKKIHLMLNKPAGLITAMEDPRHRTIAELIPRNHLAAGLFPVGRLDIDATGLLLLTNDGTLCHRLASPRWEVWKTYALSVIGKIFDTSEITKFADGLDLADGLHCRPARLEILGPQQALLTIHEGKHHQVKRMMLATGRKVTTLHRTTIGPLELDERLAPGESRELTAEEIDSLYALAELEQS